MANTNIAWQHSGSRPKLWLIDARSAAILIGAMMHITEMTIAFCLMIIGFLFYIERYKRITPEAAVRLIILLVTNFIISNKRSVLGVRRKRYFSDKRILDIS